MALDPKWLHAQFNLGFKVVVHYLKKLWPWSPRYGLVRFQENYVVDALPPASPSFRADLAAQPGRCTGCGACDDVCPILAGETDVDDGDFMGPRAFVLAGARAAPHLDDQAETLAIMTGPVCHGCRKCDEVCPEVIPITTLAYALNRQRAEVHAARAGKVPILPADVGPGGRLVPKELR